MPVGRPSDYDPAYCERVIEWGKQGKSRTWMAAELNCCRNTLKVWEQAHPEFMSAMAEAAVKSQQWWEDSGQSGLTADKYNAAIWSRSMAARFPEEWRENSRTEHTGKDGGAIQTEELSGRDLARRIALTLAQAK